MRSRRVACLVFYNHEKKVLIQDRRGLCKYSKYGWFGGGIKEGETVEQALKREIKEELDLNITNFKFIGDYVNYYPDLTVHVNLFITALPKQKLNCSEGKPLLVTIEEAKKLLSAGDLIILNKIKQWLYKSTPNSEEFCNP